MTKIKICGLRRKVDIEYVNELKPDYAGFVFAQSRRRVETEEAKQLIAGLDKAIKTVGIFVDEDVNSARERAEFLRLDVLQFHGKETAEYIRKFMDYEVWKAIGVSSEEDLKNLTLYPADSFLLDSKGKDSTGGSGICINWNILKALRSEKPVFLAGGLEPGNVVEAIKTVKPYGVDVSSGVESHGFKDFDKIKEFIRKVRELD
jgi:phosphoribosylanthranilate isomerase